MIQDHTPLAAAAEHARMALSLALSEIALLPLGEERDSRLNSIATIMVGSSDETWADAIRQCLDLTHAKPTPDGVLHASELEAVSRLKESDIGVIDRTLVSNSTDTWRKATRIVGHTLVDLNNELTGIPLGFFAQRMAALVQSGELEVQGNLDFIRLCELRLSTLGRSGA